MYLHILLCKSFIACMYLFMSVSALDPTIMHKSQLAAIPEWSLLTLSILCYVMFIVVEQYDVTHSVVVLCSVCLFCSSAVYKLPY